MNQYDHEDAFKDANRFAGGRTKIADALKLADTEYQARAIILHAQETYQGLFDALIAGVDWAREQNKKQDGALQECEVGGFENREDGTWFLLSPAVRIYKGMRLRELPKSV
jgi:hypothetical protein